jgi:hypothetical protein
VVHGWMVDAVGCLRDGLVEEMALWAIFSTGPCPWENRARIQLELNGEAFEAPTPSSVQIISVARIAHLPGPASSLRASRHHPASRNAA